MIIALFVASLQCGIVTMTCLWVPGGPSKAVAIDPYLQTLHYRIELKRHLVHKHLDIKNLSCCLETSALPGSQPEHGSEWCYCKTVTIQNLTEHIDGFLILLSQCICITKCSIIDMYYTTKSDLLRTQALADEEFLLGPVSNIKNHLEHPSNQPVHPSNHIARLWQPSRASEYWGGEFCMRTTHIYIRKCKALEGLLVNRYNNTFPYRKIYVRWC